MTFLWMDASSSLHADDNAEPCTFWWLRSCLIFCCSLVQTSRIGLLYWPTFRLRPSVVQVKVGIFELEILHVANKLKVTDKWPWWHFTWNELWVQTIPENRTSNAACLFDSSQLRMKCVKVLLFSLKNMFFPKYGSKEHKPSRKWNCITLANAAHVQPTKIVISSTNVPMPGSWKKYTLVRFISESNQSK